MTISFRFISVIFLLLFLGVATSSAQSFKGFDLSGLGGQDSAAELLPDDQAFQIFNTQIESDEIVITWVSAPEYYLYRKNFKLESLTPGVSFGELSLPKGEIEQDPLFGEVEVYFGEVDVRAKIIRDDARQSTVEFNVLAQGCNKPVGICYPPQKRHATISLASFDTNSSVEGFVKERGDERFVKQAKGAVFETDKSYFAYILSAFVAGILLVFTPCVLPMLPILSGIVVGGSADKRKKSRLRAGALALAYVLGTAVTYTVMGVVAGAAGIQLQAYFQHPIAITVMVLILLMLALAMFGLFDIALPTGAQGRLSNITNRFKSGTLPVAFIIGLLSALIVSACVSPLLITALGVAIKKGDPILGGAMMFAMSLGMGVLLVTFAMGASWMMPKAGAWMERVKALFGFAILAVAIIVASSIASVPVLLLWAALLIVFALWLWKVAATAKKSQIVLQALAVLSLLWGGAAFIGGLSGGTQLLNPLLNLTASNNGSKNQQAVVFNKVYTANELQLALAKAKSTAKPVLVDYYADWCTDCKRMDESTYVQSTVIAALNGWEKIKVDVTQVNEQTQAAKKHFGVFGPPATLFVGVNGEVLTELSRYGYISESELLDLLEIAQ